MTAMQAALAPRHDNAVAPPDLIACDLANSDSVVPQFRRLVGTAADHWGLSADTKYALMIIVSELASNAFLHSGSPDMRLLLRNRQGSVEVEVADHGRWKDQRPHAAAHLKTDGRGLQITQAYADDFTVHRSDSGTRAVANVVKPQASQAV